MSRIIRRGALAAALSGLALAAPAAAAPGDPDPSFGAGGVAFGDVQGAPYNGFALAPAPDGKLWFGADPYTNYNTFVIGGRRKADGDWDSSFGNSIYGGEVEVGEQPSVGGIAPAPGGKLYIGGQAKLDVNDPPGIFIARLAADGRPDPAFSPGGGDSPGTMGGDGNTDDRLTIAGGPTYTRGIATTPDGGVVAVAQEYAAGQMMVAKYTAGGVLDGTFGDLSSGRVTFDPPSADGALVPKAIAVDPSGRIVVVGAVNDSTSSRLLVVRLKADGSADPSFGGGGTLILSAGTEGYPTVEGVAFPAGGGIVLGIDTFANGKHAMGALRLRDDGTPDPAFAGGGVAVANLPGDHAAAVGVGVQADGSVVVGGYAIGGHRWLAARFTPAGLLDGGFGSGGLAGIDVGVGESTPQDLIVSGDTVVLGGYADAGDLYGMRTTFARLLAGPTGTTPGGGDPGPPGPGETPIAPPIQPVVVAPVPTVSVQGYAFTLVRSTVRTVTLPKLGRGFAASSGLTMLHATVPYLDPEIAFDDEVCSKDVNEGEIYKMTPAGGTTVVVDAAHPAHVTLSICLSDKKYEATCSASAITKLLGQAKTHVDEVTAIYGELARCKVDYDVAFTKKPAEPKVTQISNPKYTGGGTPPKRKTIETAIQCSTAAGEQDLNLGISGGVLRNGIVGPHESDGRLGWTLPAGAQGSFKVTLFDKSLPNRAAEALLLVDTDAVGAAKINPVKLTGGGGLPSGQRIVTLSPTKAGMISICALIQTADGGYATATAQVEVVAKPKSGTLWTSTSGWTQQLTVTGAVAPPAGAAAAGGPVAHAANLWDDFVSVLTAVFGGRSTAVNTAAKAGGTAEARTKKAAQSGAGVAQIGNGGRLGRTPGAGRAATGTLTYVDDRGVVHAGRGQVVEKNPDGTLIGVDSQVGNAPGLGNVSDLKAKPLADGAGVIAPGGANVIAPGGGNVIAPGGGNVIAAGGGNVIAPGGANVIAPGGANIVAPGGGN